MQRWKHFKILIILLTGSVKTGNDKLKYKIINKNIQYINTVLSCLIFQDSPASSPKPGMKILTNTKWSSQQLYVFALTQMYFHVFSFISVPQSPVFSPSARRRLQGRPRASCHPSAPGVMRTETTWPSSAGIRLNIAGVWTRTASRFLILWKKVLLSVGPSIPVRAEYLCSTAYIMILLSIEKK